MAKPMPGIGPVSAPDSLTPEGLAALIDHTNLKAFTTAPKIQELCEEAAQWGFAAVCLNPVHVPLAAKVLSGTRVAVCTVVGFPLGASRSTVKAFEAGVAVEEGATEVDMVVNVAALREGEYALFLEDLRAVVAAAAGRLVKVILETCYLTDDQIVKGCELAREAGADYVKTSTGFGAFGAFERHVRLMRATVGDTMGVKASGGIQDFREALRLVRAGASRLGVSASVPIVEGYRMLKYTRGWLAEEIPCRLCPSRAANMSKLPKELYLYYKAACLECPHREHNRFNE